MTEDAAAIETASGTVLVYRLCASASRVDNEKQQVTNKRHWTAE